MIIILKEKLDLLEGIIYAFRHIDHASSGPSFSYIIRLSDTLIPLCTDLTDVKQLIPH